MKGELDMQKKIINKTFTMIIVLSLFLGLIGSASAATITPNASDYLSYYSAEATTDRNSKIIISFDVNATRFMNFVGASYIVVQENSNGSWKGVASYFGSSTVGMLATDTYSHTGSISHKGTTGKQYRALVTIYAGNESGEDSRTVMTNTVTANYFL